jgi:DhnA family fructose-bisphosphate aldolase class Ia
LGDFGKAIRLHRILRAERGTLVIAFDHALVLGPIPGTLDPAGQIRRFIQAQPDAVLLNLGNFRYFAEAATADRVPGLIARLDWTTAFNEESKAVPHGFQTCLVAHPDDALRAGADAVITFFVVGSGDAEFDKREIERVGSLSRQCEHVGVPLIVESLARGAKVENPRELRWLLLHTRIAAELGADVIKTESAATPDGLREMIRACPVPVLVLGGSRSGSDDEVVSTVRGIIDAGAAGVFFGRNIFQADNMSALITRVRSVLARKASAQGH